MPGVQGHRLAQPYALHGRPSLPRVTSALPGEPDGTCRESSAPRRPTWVASHCHGPGRSVSRHTEHLLPGGQSPSQTLAGRQPWPQGNPLLWVQPRSCPLGLSGPAWEWGSRNLLQGEVSPLAHRDAGLALGLAPHSPDGALGLGAGARPRVCGCCLSTTFPAGAGATGAAQGLPPRKGRRL